MEKEKETSTPMSISCSMDKDKKGKVIDERKYRVFENKWVRNQTGKVRKILPLKEHIS